MSALQQVTVRNPCDGDAVNIQALRFDYCCTRPQLILKHTSQTHTSERYAELLYICMP